MPGIGDGLWEIEWLDYGREPRAPPNPAYPNGVDIRPIQNAAAAVVATCTRPLPYPAKRIGVYIVNCKTCDQRVVISTAGRPDDPRSLQLACRISQ